MLQVGAFPFPNPNGSQVYAGGMCAALAARGHRLRLACYAAGSGVLPSWAVEGSNTRWDAGSSSFDSPRPVELWRARRVPGGDFSHSGPHWSRPVQDLGLLRLVGRLLPGAEVVHAHNVEAALIVAAALRACPAPRPPLVFSMHARMGEELPRYARPGLRRLGGWVGQGVDRLVPRLVDSAVVISERAQRWLTPRLRGPVAHIPPGVRLDELVGGDAERARQRWQLGAGPWVGYTGNADAYQDLPVLFEAMGRVQAGLLLVTGSPLGPLHALADRLGLPPARRRFVRSVRFADTLDAMAAIAVAALPRAVCAGFPIKLLNLLGCGVPTVAAEGGARAIAGVVAVPGYDPLAMGVALQSLLDQPARRAALSLAARQAVADDWSWSRQAARLEAFYRARRSVR